MIVSRKIPLLFTYISPLKAKREFQLTFSFLLFFYLTLVKICLFPDLIFFRFRYFLKLPLQGVTGGTSFLPVQDLCFEFRQSSPVVVLTFAFHFLV